MATNVTETDSAGVEDTKSKESLATKENSSADSKVEETTGSDETESDAAKNGIDQVDSTGVPTATDSGNGVPMDVDEHELEVQSEMNVADVIKNINDLSRNEGDKPSLSEDIPGTINEAEPMETESNNDNLPPSADEQDLEPEPEPEPEPAIPSETIEPGLDEVDNSNCTSYTSTTPQDIKPVSAVEQNSRSSTPLMDEHKNGENTVIDGISDVAPKQNVDLNDIVSNDASNVKVAGHASPGHVETETKENHENQIPDTKVDSSQVDEKHIENNIKKSTDDDENKIESADTTTKAEVSIEQDDKTECKLHPSEPQDIKPKSEPTPSKKKKVPTATLP